MTRIVGLESYLHMVDDRRLSRVQIDRLRLDAHSPRAAAARSLTESAAAKRNPAATAIVDKTFIFHRAPHFSAAKFAYGTSKVFGTGTYEADGAPSDGMEFPAAPVTPRWKHRRSRARPKFEVQPAPPSASLDGSSSKFRWRWRKRTIRFRRSFRRA